MAQKNILSVSLSERTYNALYNKYYEKKRGNKKYTWDDFFSEMLGIEIKPY